MEKSSIREHPPLMLKYLKAYQANPRSRVFAPLAESYRKMGLEDKAIYILKEGIKNNPGYVLGYLGLGFCYFDQAKYQLAYSTLRPLVNLNRDNLRLQKLFGNICLKIGNNEEALETFKYLLFINPKDKEVSLRVKELEEKFCKPFLEKNEESLDQVISFDEGDFFEVDSLLSLPESKRPIEKDLWTPLEMVERKEGEHLSNKTIDPIIKDEKELASEDSEVIFAQESDEIKINEKEKELSPVVTMTLVDLYCAQGYIEKARGILLQLFSLNPDNEQVKNKIKELDVKGGTSDDSKSLKEKDEGRSVLMEEYDLKFFKSQSNNLKLLEKKLLSFCDALRLRAKNAN